MDLSIQIFLVILRAPLDRPMADPGGLWKPRGDGVGLRRA